jgi:hypothetical protein
LTRASKSSRFSLDVIYGRPEIAVFGVVDRRPSENACAARRRSAASARGRSRSVPVIRSPRPVALRLSVRWALRFLANLSRSVETSSSSFSLRSLPQVLSVAWLQRARQPAVPPDVRVLWFAVRRLRPTSPAPTSARGFGPPARPSPRRPHGLSASSSRAPAPSSSRSS